MNLTILQIGKTRQPFFVEAEKEYLKRLGPYAKVSVVTLKETELPKGNVDAGRNLVKEKEAKEILAHLKEGDVIIALDERGKEYDSRGFADLLDSFKTHGTPNITFIIGGSYGLSEEITKLANQKIALSRLTFTHEMVRTILLEQLYRAFTILQGKTYHY